MKIAFKFLTLVVLKIVALAILVPLVALVFGVVIPLLKFKFGGEK